EWRHADVASDRDVMASLVHDEVYGRPLTDAEIASILRNWTAGEIGTIAASIGIVVHYLAVHQDIQAQLRGDPSVLATAIDEILRIEGPLVMNRRVTTRAVELGGRTIGANERVALNWVSANRDETVFENPDEFRLDRNANDNLLYGAGIHVCPGAPLARLELLLTLEELLSRTTRIELDADAAAERAVFPASGYASLPVIIW
ncbi:MAG: cytochrome P450, partial [Thermomicrobiales bacterium]|nr:cytochrome P450 [Thermomicrobiales bacterium]